MWPQKGNFMRLVGLDFSENQKMVLINGDQYPKMHLPSNLQPNLRFCDHPIAHLRKYTLTLTILILPVIINALEKKWQHLLVKNRRSANQ